MIRNRNKSNQNIAELIVIELVMVWEWEDCCGDENYVPKIALNLKIGKKSDQNSWDDSGCHGLKSDEINLISRKLAPATCSLAVRYISVNG